MFMYLKMLAILCDNTRVKPTSSVTIYFFIFKIHNPPNCSYQSHVLPVLVIDGSRVAHIWAANLRAPNGREMLVAT